MSPGARVLLITGYPREHQRLASELHRRGIRVTLASQEAVALRELRCPADMVLVDLASAGGFSAALVRRLNAPKRQAPVVALCNGAWPPLTAPVSELRLDGLARADDSLPIALAAASAAPYEGLQPSLH